MSKEQSGDILEQVLPDHSGRSGNPWLVFHGAADVFR